MAYTKTIAVSSILIILSTLGFVYGPEIFTTPHYYCEQYPEMGLIACENVINETICVSNVKEIVCENGWALVTKDTEIRAVYVCNEVECKKQGG